MAETINKIRIAFIDGQQIYREGLKGLFASDGLLEVVYEAETTEEIIAHYSNNFSEEVDILLMELGETPLESIRCIEQLSNEHPKVKVAVLTDNIDKSYVLLAVQAGASGYMLKEMDLHLIIEAIRHISAGTSYIHPKVTHHLINAYLMLNERKHKGVFKQEEIRMPLHLLTKRECEVLQLLADGRGNIEISHLLFISDKTVKNHVSSILSKMNVVHRTAAAVIAIKNGWVKI
ncbi:response regulator transcription factor [Sporosarcina sp. FSL K6-1508]|uniref:response regulator transcription factor n=1 Tax=Sporosarcina sp. FSL K6-1508 TaxID=2921553 RepID=UPI0030F8EFC1